jgi:hypothetical protein
VYFYTDTGGTILTAVNVDLNVYYGHFVEMVIKYFKEEMPFFVVLGFELRALHLLDKQGFEIGSC